MQQSAEALIQRNLHREDGRIVHYQSLAGTERLLYYYEKIVMDEHLISINAKQAPDMIHADILAELEKINLSPKQINKNKQL